MHVSRFSVREIAASGVAMASAAPVLNDKTGSIFIAKDKFDEAVKAVGMQDAMAADLWRHLAGASSQRIVAGASKPREDAANVNNWHWFETDLAPWAKDRLTALLVGVEAKGVPDKGWVRVVSVEACNGEASVSNRKGKRIVAYELDVKCKWKGEVRGCESPVQLTKSQVDYDEVEGELLLPYVSEDVADSGYEIKLVAKDRDDASHTKALRYLEKQLPEVKARLKTFTEEIYTK